jgi:large subunit ribosomal protein L1
MATLTSKRTKSDVKLVDKTKTYSIQDAIKILKSATKTKFDPTIELQCKLGVDLTANDQVVRGTTVLPHGRGKMPKVIVFSKDESSKAAKEAGADVVGGDDLVEKVMGGWLEFDVAISTPTMMKDVGKLGKVLGPRGLMPSPKAGTVTDNPAKAVKEIKSGRIEFKMDKQGNVHTAVAKLSFADDKIIENTTTLIEALLRAKPRSAKGVFIKSIHMSSTMGPGVRIDISKFLKETETTED